jgi:hypothetical protein
MALPPATRITAAPVKPTDVIVIECDEHISKAIAEHIKASIQPIWPGQKIIVLEKGLHLKVVEGA